MSNNNNQRVFFVHVPKCAGMTLASIIEQQYSGEEIYTMPSVGSRDEHYRALRDEWSIDRKSKLRVVKGHIVYGWHRAFGDDKHEYITILRHPIERILSYFSFIGDWSPDHQYSIDELVTKSNETRNLATFMLAGGRGPEHFQMVWTKILSGEMLAGTVEHFDQYVDVLRERYEWKREDYKPINVTANRVKRDEISRETQKKIIKNNWLDYLLYVGVIARNNRGNHQGDFAHV